MNRQSAESMVKRGIQIELDSDKEKRQAALLCPYCYYGGARMAGQAFTTAYCGLCKASRLFSNTDVDRVCEDCATKHDLCIHCGADRELRKDRKVWPETVPE